MSKYYSGQTCPATATYGQYSDRTGEYAGREYDRYVEKGKNFPPSLNNYHFRAK